MNRISRKEQNATSENGFTRNWIRDKSHGIAASVLYMFSRVYNFTFLVHSKVCLSRRQFLAVITDCRDIRVVKRE